MRRPPAGASSLALGLRGYSSAGENVRLYWTQSWGTTPRTATECAVDSFSDPDPQRRIKLATDSPRECHSEGQQRDLHEILPEVFLAYRDHVAGENSTDMPFSAILCFCGMRASSLRPSWTSQLYVSCAASSAEHARARRSRCKAPGRQASGMQLLSVYQWGGAEAAAPATAQLGPC